MEHTIEEIISREVASSLLKAGYPQFNADQYWVRKPKGDWCYLQSSKLWKGIRYIQAFLRRRQ